MIWDLGSSINSSNSPETYFGNILQIAAATCGQCWTGYQSCGNVVTLSVTPNCCGASVVAHCCHSISDTNSVPWSEPPFVTMLLHLCPHPPSGLWYHLVILSYRQRQQHALQLPAKQQSCRVPEICGFWEVDRCWEKGGKNPQDILL